MRNKKFDFTDNIIAAVFTMMLPGLGQMIKERAIPGIVWAVAVGGGYLLNGWVGLTFHILCILDAAFSEGFSSLFNRTEWLKKSLLLFGLSALLVYTVLRTALF